MHISHNIIQHGSLKPQRNNALHSHQVTPSYRKNQTRKVTPLTWPCSLLLMHEVKVHANSCVGVRMLFYSNSFTVQVLDKSWSQVLSLLPPGFSFFFFTHGVQESQCPSIYHRVLLTHALVLAACKCEDKKVSTNLYVRDETDLYQAQR